MKKATGSLRVRRHRIDVYGLCNVARLCEPYPLLNLS
jgi:hypothetical protein